MMKQRTTHIIKSYNQESDRGFVLIMAADLDDALGQLHRTCIEESVNPKPKAKLVDDLFGKFGPLSTFASRNLLAYAYGLIDKSVFDDLERLRKVRNLVAHSIADISLVDVYDVVNSMGSMKRTAAKFNRTAATVEKSAKGIRQHLFQTWINLWIELAEAEARFVKSRK